MPAASAPAGLAGAAAAERRRSFEEFLGVCEASRGARRRRRKARCPGVECNLHGDWTPLPEPVAVVRSQELGVGHFGSSTATIPPKTLFPTSFEAHEGDWRNDEQVGFSWKSAAILLGIAAASGGAGFAVAMSTASPATGQPEGSQQASGTTSAVETADSQAPATALGAAPATEQDTAQQAADEEERLKRMQELQDRQVVASEKRDELLQQKQELHREIDPNVEEVEAELRELDARIAAEQNAPLDGQAVVDPVQAASGIYAQVGARVFDGDNLQKVLEERVAVVRQRIPEIINEELNSGMNDLNAALSGDMPGMGGSSQMMDDMPSLSLMIAGLAAPKQLSMLQGENMARLGLSAFMLLMDGLALGTSWDSKCVTWVFGVRGSFLKPWMGVDFLSILFTVVIRMLAMQSVNKTLAQTEAFQKAPMDTHHSTDMDPTAAFRLQLERHLLTGSQAMLQLDKLAGDPFFKMLDVLPAFDFIWQMGGIAILFDTPGDPQFCAAELLLDWSRARGVLFLVGLLPAIIGLALALAKNAAASKSACTAMLKGAGAADRLLFKKSGPPIVTILVRAFLVRDATEMQSMELRVMNFEKRIAKTETDKLRNKLEQAEVELAQHSHKYEAQLEIMRAKSKEEEFMEQYKEAVVKVCETLEFVADPGAAAADAAAQMQAAMGVQQLHIPTVPHSARGAVSTGGDEGFDGGTGSSLLSGALGAAGLPDGATTARSVASAAASRAQEGAATAAAAAQGGLGHPGASPSPRPTGQGDDSQT